MKRHPSGRPKRAAEKREHRISNVDPYISPRLNLDRPARIGFALPAETLVKTSHDLAEEIGKGRQGGLESPPSGVGTDA